MHFSAQPHSRHASYRPIWVIVVVVLAVALALNACSTTAGTTATNTSGQSTLPTETIGSSSTGGGGNPTATAGSAGSHPTATTGSSSGGSTPTATPAPTLPAHTSFVWTAQSSNITDNWTTIDNLSINGDAAAILIVTPDFNPNGVYDNHPIGVWYYAGSWTIFHQDKTPMIPGASFNVMAFPTSVTGVTVWGAQSNCTAYNIAYICDDLIPAGSAAHVLVTPVYNTQHAYEPSVYDDHPIGVRWDGKSWEIFNQDQATMPVNALFNLVSFVGATSGTFVQTATSGNSAGDYTIISGNSVTDSQPGVVLECTPVYNPNNVYDDHNIGVWYDAPHWTIFNQDQAAIPTGASFYCAA